MEGSEPKDLQYLTDILRQLEEVARAALRGGTTPFEEFERLRAEADRLRRLLGATQVNPKYA